MILAEIPEQLIFVVVMLVIAAIKALGEKFGKKPEQTYEEYEEDDSVEADYEEYTRQLRKRQAEILTRQQQAESPPPLPNAAPVVFEKPYNPPVVKKPKLSAAEKNALENFQKTTPSRKKSSPIGIGSTARARARRVLSSPNAARDAIVLSEILGPPKGQRS